MRQLSVQLWISNFPVETIQKIVMFIDPSELFIIEVRQNLQLTLGRLGFLTCVEDCVSIKFQKLWTELISNNSRLSINLSLNFMSVSGLLYDGKIKPAATHNSEQLLMPTPGVL